MSTININKVNNQLRNSIDYTYEAVYNSKNGHEKFKVSLEFNMAADAT